MLRKLARVRYAPGRKGILTRESIYLKGGSSMKQHTNNLHNSRVHDEVPLHHSIFNLYEPLSEADIIILQEKFLTPGFHYLKVKNEATGRDLIQIFLESLTIYHTVACLSTLHEQLPEAIIDVYKEFIVPGVFENFIFESSALDFMWVEATTDLRTEKWFDYCNQAIMDNHLDSQIPIMFLTYGI